MPRAQDELQVPAAAVPGVATIKPAETAVAKATEELGTKTPDDTVHEALARVVRVAAFEREVEFAKAGTDPKPEDALKYVYA